MLTGSPISGFTYRRALGSRAVYVFLVLVALTLAQPAPVRAHEGEEMESEMYHGDGKDVAWGVAVDAEGNTYVTGYTHSPVFPTVNALQPDLNGPKDAFVTKLRPGGSRLEHRRRR